jgi:NOL1/NOP2/fmu family ribosome biogenesis protein
MIIQILDSTKKKDFLSEVDYLGEIKTNYLFVKTGKETVRAFSGSLHVDDILKIWRNVHIEGVGLYVGKQFVDKHGRKETRLSLDALHLFKNQIKKNILELNDEQIDSWFHGNNIQLNEEQRLKYKFTGFVVVKYGEDFAGTGKLTEQGILLSFLPKERRIKN